MCVETMLNLVCSCCLRGGVRFSGGCLLFLSAKNSLSLITLTFFTNMSAVNVGSCILVSQAIVTPIPHPTHCMSASLSPCPDSINNVTLGRDKQVQTSPLRLAPVLCHHVCVCVHLLYSFSMEASRVLYVIHDYHGACWLSSTQLTIIKTSLEGARGEIMVMGMGDRIGRVGNEPVQA